MATALRAALVLLVTLCGSLTIGQIPATLAAAQPADAVLLQPTKEYLEPAGRAYVNYCGPGAVAVALDVAGEPGADVVGLGDAQHLNVAGNGNITYMTKSDGSGIVELLNRSEYLAGSDYTYSTEQDQSAFLARLKQSVNFKRALITSVDTGTMPGWTHSAPHIVAVVGYSPSSQQVAYVETAHHDAGYDGTHQVQWTSLSTFWSYAIARPSNLIYAYATKGTVNAAVDVALIIDSSGSMVSNDAQDRRKSAAKYFIDLAQVGDQIAVVDFDETSHTWAPLKAIQGQATRSALKVAVDQVDSAGTTSLSAGLQEGYTQLAVDTSTRPKAAVFLTDGDGAYNNEAALYRARHWPIYTIGLGSGVNASLLQQIADATATYGGKYYPAPTNAVLQQIYQAISSQIQSQVPLGSTSIQLQQGQQLDLTTPVAAGSAQLTFSTSWPGSDVGMQLTRPSGGVIDATTVATGIYHAKGSTYEIFRIDAPEEGNWGVRLTGVVLAAGGEEVTLNISATAAAEPLPLPRAYTFTYLGTLGGTDSYGLDLNNAAQAVGFSFTTGPSSHGFRWQSGALTDLGTFPGGTGSFARAISQTGVVVGDAITAGGAYHAFRWQDNAMTDLGVLTGYTGSVAEGINAKGQIVGASNLGFTDYRATLWQNGAIIDLGTLGGGGSDAASINDSGQIVGGAQAASGATHAFLWQNGAMIDLGTLGGTASYAYAINARGQVVGVADTASGAHHAFLWQDGTMTDLGTLPGKANSAAKAINDYGIIVGNAYDDPEFPTPFVYGASSMVGLNTLRAVGTVDSVYSAEGINNAGQIICEGYHSQGGVAHAGAQLLTPVAPAALTVPPTSGGTATFTRSGDLATLTATPAQNYLFLGWQVSGSPVAHVQAIVAIDSWANPLHLTLTQDTTITPVFALAHTFGDIAPGDFTTTAIANPASTAIINLAARGIINGCDAAASPPRFCPDDSTLRHQMAALIVRAMPGWSAEVGLPTFTDNTDDTELMTRVATVQRHGVAQGYANATCQEQHKIPPCYGPLDTVKYGQVMLFIARAMVEKGYWALQADDRTIFPDQNGAVGADPGTDRQTLDHRMVITFVHYAGAPPDVDASPGRNFLVNGVSHGGWGDDAPRAWFARALWQALDSYFGH